jgi:hypothetical protein
MLMVGDDGNNAWNDDAFCSMEWRHGLQKGLSWICLPAADKLRVGVFVCHGIFPDWQRLNISFALYTYIIHKGQ